MEHMNVPIDIELLYFDGCPSYRQALADLADIIVEGKLDAAVRFVSVDTPEKADELHFAGSPTIKVNGRDLEDYRGPGVLACRVYEENGNKGWPSKELLERRLLEALEVEAAA